MKNVATDPIEILVSKCDEADWTIAVGILLDAIYYLRVGKYPSFHSAGTERLMNGYLEIA